MSENSQNWVPATPAALTSYAIMTWMAGAFMLGFVNPSALYFAGLVAIVAFIPLFVTGVTSLKDGGLGWRQYVPLFLRLLCSRKRVMLARSVFCRSLRVGV